ncbi:tRNA-splicing endonuclease subunit Sen34 [Phlebotomus argentipes]|uniref:tRNA-splicing endonuclease subunit Sen34 n=1 Tax=Phlebotomus argentipes TaxID=94469 RepID=UPI0028938158|nr:tRNA-splicing endonuclease subunit Sen34 [Phlebotomus argentipes]
MSAIQLNIIENRGFLFNTNDYMTLRTEHRIVGTLIGCNVNNPRSNAIGGLPAVFSEIEVRFLVEKGLVSLRRNSGLRAPPAPECVQQYRSFLDAQLQDQRRILKKRKVGELEENLEKIMSGQRQKLLKSGVKEADVVLDREKILQDKINEIPELSRENLLVQIPTEHMFRGSEEESVILPPFSRMDELKYKVFSSLWEKGVFVTSGSTFGGDFLIYPSDPLLVHASHVVHVLEDSEVDSRKFVACNRLCVGVKKSCMFAYEDTSGKIIYLTSQFIT